MQPKQLEGGIQWPGKEQQKQQRKHQLQKEKRPPQKKQPVVDKIAI
ncbi:MAG: hypothetical protein ACE5GN_00450 [Waddliaceae bacterium]